MRVSTMQQFNNGITNILSNQASVNKTQQQISSGRRVLTPADDPIASTRILQLQQDIALREQYSGNLVAAKNHLNLEEATLVSMVDNLQRVRELTVQAGDGSLTKEDRRAIGAEINERLYSIVDLMNTKDASNIFIFAGFKGETLPFEERPGGGFTYEGDEGQRTLQISQNAEVATNDTGKELFVDIASAKNTFTTFNNRENIGTGYITTGFVLDQEEYDEFYSEDAYIQFNPRSAVSPSGPNYTVRRLSDDRPINGLANIDYSQGNDIQFNGISVKVAGEPEPGDTFVIESSEKQALTDTVQMLLEGLNTIPDSVEGGAQVAELVETTLLNLDAALTSISTIRSDLGARLNTVDAIDNLQQDLDLVSQEILSELQDVDFAEAVSRLSLESFLLEASQQSYSRISSLSLFNFL